MATFFPIDIGLDMGRILNRMLNELSQFLAQTNAAIDPAVILISVNNVPVGLGNFLGEEPRSLGGIELKGGRLDCIVRFILWEEEQTAVNEAMLNLQAELLAASQRLASIGFLRFNALTSTNPLFDSTSNAWGRTADYGLLYEYRYQEIDAADSLIVQIPIHTDLEAVNSPERENSTVTDNMARWDEQSAPVLSVRGPDTLGQLSALVFTPSMPTGPVTLIRTFDGATGPPVDHNSDLPGFLAGLANPIAPQRHAGLRFPSFADFLAQFIPAGDPVQMGDWNQDNSFDRYQGFELSLDPPVRLEHVIDRLELSYGNGSEPLNQVAVVYLRFR